MSYPNYGSGVPAGAYPGPPAGAYPPPPGAYPPPPPAGAYTGGGYQEPPAGTYQPSYQQPQQTTVYVYNDKSQADRDRELAEDCCLLACCCSLLCCCLANN